MLTFFHNREDHSSQFQVASTAAAHTHEQHMLTFFHSMEDHSNQFQVASTIAAYTHEQQMLTFYRIIEDRSLLFCESMINPFLVLKGTWQ
jgi:hypothetical protein